MKKRIIAMILSIIMVIGMLPTTVFAAEVVASKTELYGLSLGRDHSAVVKSDGSLWTWGWNGLGQLGDGTTTDQHTPIKIMDDVLKVNLSGDNGAAIKTDNTLWVWGSNDSGQIGNGTAIDQYTPLKIMDDVIDVCFGYGYCAAIKTDGSLWMWGENFYGQLGNGSNVRQYTPIKIMDDVIAVSLGVNHSAAIKSDGSLWLWGYNSDGQLGNGNNDVQHSPVKVMDNVIQVSLKGNHSAAVQADGSLWMWGYNSAGQLGDGTTVNRNVPVKIMEDVASVSLGANAFSSAIKADGSLWTWGYNLAGQLGDGTELDRYLPVKIMDNVILIALGGVCGAAIKGDGSLWTWGNNRAGQLGDGTTTHRYSPVRIMDLYVSQGDSEGENPEGNTTYTCFGQYNGATQNIVSDPTTGINKYLMETVTIDGITYNVADTCEQEALLLPTDYLGNYYYIAYNLNASNEVSEAKIMPGIVCTLEGYDPATKVVDTDYEPIIPVGENRTLPSGSFYVSDVTASSFPTDEISSWVGDQIRIYCVGEQIFKVIHITALTGNVTSFDALSVPQKVYIDDIAYTIVGNDSSLVEQCRTNQFNEVIAVLYDGVVVQLISVDEAIELQVALGLGSNSRVRYSNGTYQRNSTLDRTNQISAKVSLTISEYFNDNLNCLKSLHEFDTLINAISIKSLSNGISFAGNDTVNLSIPSDKQLLTIGESLRFTTSFNFNNSYVPYNNELMHINCEVTGVQDNYNVSASANTHFTIITKESDTSESTGGNEEDTELQETISDNKDELKISGSFAWDSLFKTNFLTDAQADQIKYAIMSAVASTTLPEDTFDDYVAEKVLSQFCKYNNYGLGVENIDVTVPIRIDTKNMEISL